MSNPNHGSKHTNDSNSLRIIQNQLNDSDGKSIDLGVDRGSSLGAGQRSEGDPMASTQKQLRQGQFIGNDEFRSLEKSMASGDDTFYQNKKIQKLAGPDPYTAQFDDHLREKLENILSHEKIEEVLDLIQQIEETEKTKQKHARDNSSIKIRNQAQLYDDMKNELNLENTLDPNIVTHEHVYNAQKAMIQKHRELFLNGLDDDSQIIHQMNKKYMLSQLMPFNAKLLETRIQLVEIYAWIHRMARVLKKTHTAVFKGISEQQDAVDLKGPFERKNQPLVSMEIVHELNIIGKKDYDQERIFDSYQSDSESDNRSIKSIQDPDRHRGCSLDFKRAKSDKASDGQSEKVEFLKTKKESELDEKIREQTSLKKTLLKYQNKIMNDNVHGFYFARRLKLDDIVEDHNNARSKNKIEEDQNESQNEVDDEDESNELESKQTNLKSKSPLKIIETQIKKSGINKAKQPDTPKQKYENPVEEQPFLHPDLQSPIKPREVDKNLYQKEKINRLNNKKSKSKALDKIKTDTIFDQYNQTINQLQKTIDKNYVDQTGVNQKFQTVFDDFKAKFDKFIEKFSGTTFEDKIVEQFTNQFQKVFDAKMTDQKQYLQSQIEKLKQRFEDEQRDASKLFSSIQDKLRNHHNKFMEHQRDINQVNNRIDRIKEYQTAFDAELKNLGCSKLDYSDYHIDIEKFEKNMSTFTTQLDQCRVECTTLDRFVDRYLPVRIQTQLCDTLHNILGPSSRHRLQIYEISAFKKLNNAVLSDQSQYDGQDNIQLVPIDLNISIKETLDSLIKTLKECQAREDARKLTQAQNNLKNRKKGGNKVESEDSKVQEITEEPEEKEQEQKKEPDNPLENDFGEEAELFDSDEDDKVQQEKIKAYRAKKKAEEAKPKGPSLMEIFSQKLKSGLDGKIKELKAEQLELEKQNSAKKMDVALEHMMNQELDKIHDLTEILESQNGRLTKLEMKFPFKQEHILKMMKTFLFIVKGQEERQKFQLKEVTRQFEKLIADNQMLLVDYFNQENQRKIEKVIEFDEKLEKLKGIEDKYHKKFNSLKDKYEQINSIIHNQLRVDEQNQTAKWQFVSEWISIQNLVDQKLLSIITDSRNQNLTQSKQETEHEVPLQTMYKNQNAFKIDTQLPSYQSGLNIESRLEEQGIDTNFINSKTCKPDPRDRSLLQTSLDKVSSNLVSPPRDDHMVEIPIQKSHSHNDKFIVKHKGYNIKLQNLIEMRLLLLDKINEANNQYSQSQLIDSSGTSASRDIFADMVDYYYQFKRKASSLITVDINGEDREVSRIDRMNLSKDYYGNDDSIKQKQQLLVFHERMDEPSYIWRNNIKTSFQKQRSKKHLESFHSLKSNMFQTFNAENNTSTTVDAHNQSTSLKFNEKKMISDMEHSLKRFSNSQLREQSKMTDASSMDLIVGSVAKAKRNYQSLTKLNTSNKKQTTNLNATVNRDFKIAPLANSLEPIKIPQSKVQQKFNQTFTIHNFSKVKQTSMNKHINNTTSTKLLMQQHTMRTGNIRDFANISQTRKQFNPSQQVIPKKQVNHLAIHGNIRVTTPGIEIQQSQLTGKKMGLESRFATNQSSQQQSTLKSINTKKVHGMQNLTQNKSLDAGTEMSTLPHLLASTSSDTHTASKRVPEKKHPKDGFNLKNMNQRQYLETRISQSAQNYLDNTGVDQSKIEESGSGKSKMLITFGEDHEGQGGEKQHVRTNTEMNILQNNLEATRRDNGIN